AAAALGPSAAGCVPGLLRAFEPGFKDDLFSLDDHRQSQPLERPTTARLEALRALRAIGPKARPALPLLRVLAGRSGSEWSDTTPGLRAEVASTIAAIGAGGPPADAPPCACQ